MLDSEISYQDLRDALAELERLANIGKSSSAYRERTHKLSGLLYDFINGRDPEVSRVEYHRPVGTDIVQWCEDARNTRLYEKGDTVLVWVNESDLYSGLMKPTKYRLVQSDKAG